VLAFLQRLVDEKIPHQILIANDVSIQRLELGKPYGSVPLPMGFLVRTDEMAN